MPRKRAHVSRRAKRRRVAQSKSSASVARAIWRDPTTPGCTYTATELVARVSGRWEKAYREQVQPLESRVLNVTDDFERTRNAAAYSERLVSFVRELETEAAATGHAELQRRAEAYRTAGDVMLGLVAGE